MAGLARILRSAVVALGSAALVLTWTPRIASADTPSPRVPTGAFCKPFEYYYPDVSGICAATPIGGTTSSECAPSAKVVSTGTDRGHTWVAQTTGTQPPVAAARAAP